MPFPSPGNLPNPGIEPTSPAWEADFFLPLSQLGMDRKQKLLGKKNKKSLGKMVRAVSLTYILWVPGLSFLPRLAL